MAKGLELSDDLSLPPDAVALALALLSIRGAGKTYTASVLAEEMLGRGFQVVWCDPVGVAWGLRLNASGKSKGFDIAILGGDRGDLPLDEGSGKLVANLVVDEGVSAILDLSLLRKAQMVRFMTDFAEHLYRRKASRRDPLHMILDEADLFAPQKPYKGQERMLGATEDLVRRGRARGLGISMLTQRSAVLNKDVLTQAEILVALRTIGKRDRDAIDDWVEAHGTKEQRDELMGSIASLPNGEAWVWAPMLGLFRRVRIRRRRSFDSSATPKVGTGPTVQPKSLSDLDLATLRTQMAEVVEREEATDPRRLQRRVAELERDLAKRPAHGQGEKVEVPVQVEVPVPMLSEAQMGEMEDLLNELREAGEANRELVDVLDRFLKAQQSRERKLVAALTRVAKGLEGVIETARAPRKAVPARPATARRPARPVPTRPSRPNREPSGDEAVLRKGERAVLEVLARRYPLQMTWAQVAQLSGYTSTGGTFGTYMSVLKRHDLGEGGKDAVRITEAGLAWLGVAPPAQAMTHDELVEMWMGALRAGERAILEALLDLYPKWLSKEEIAERTGFTPSGGTFGTYLSVLRRNDLIVVHGNEARASDSLYP